jgi:LmeA-like phospholipid-binding
VSRSWIRAAVAVAVLLLLVAVMDRVGARLAGGAVADGLTTSQRLSRPATVSFPDVPFLTQALRGRYDTVEVTMEGLPAGSGLVVDRIDATLHGVSAPAGALVRGELDTLPVQRGEAVAFVSFGSLRAAARKELGRQVESLTMGRAAADRVTIAATVRTAFGTFGVRGQAQLSVSRGSVAVRLLPRTISGVPSIVRSQLPGLIDLSSLVPPLPFGFRATGVTVEAGGLRLTAAGTGLVLPT